MNLCDNIQSSLSQSLQQSQQLHPDFTALMLCQQLQLCGIFDSHLYSAK